MGLGEPGLYPGGANEPSGVHLAYGETSTDAIQLRDASGNPSSDGLIGFLSIGMSNTNQKWSRFEREADRAGEHDGRVVLMDGAQGGVDAVAMSDPDHMYWGNLDVRIASSGVSPNQIQAVWLMQSLRGETGTFPTAPEMLRDGIQTVVSHLVARFPNLAVVYLSSRAYGGYIDREPYAYESAFGVKWLIEDQVDALAAMADVGPWLTWGPYIWANGECPTEDGLFYLATDFEDGGANVHPDIGAETKVADIMRLFFRNDPRSSRWYAPDQVEIMTLDAVHDATVFESTPDLTVGDALTLDVGPGSDVHVRFELPDIDPADLVHAKLSLFVDPGLAGRELSVHGVAPDAWDESTLTWDEAPTVGEAITATGRYSRGSAMSVSLTAAVRAAIASGALNIAFRADGETVLWSKEAGDGPRLILSVRSSPGLDAGIADGGAEDAAVPSDAGLDAGSVDAGTVEDSGGCGCRTTSSASSVWALLMLLALVWRRP